MKKIVLSALAIATLTIGVSCKNEAKTEKETTATKTEKVETKKEEKKTTTKASNGVPSFDSKEVQEYVNAYEAYLNEYKEAAEKKDMSAFAALGQKGQELATKAQEINGNISAEDAKRLGEYMTEKAKLIQEYSSKMMN